VRASKKCGLWLELAQRQRWALVALDLAVDTSTPAGEMFGNLLLTMARFEKRLIGQRTRDALAVKKAAGVRLGRPPPPCPPDIVDRILQQRRAGHSYPHIATQLNNEQVPTAHGGSRWWPATIASVHHSHSEIAPHDPAATYAPTLVGRLTYAIGRRLGSHQTAATSSTALSMSKHAKPAAELK